MIARTMPGRILERFMCAINIDNRMGSMTILALEGATFPDLYGAVDSVEQFRSFLASEPEPSGLWVAQLIAVDWPSGQELPSGLIDVEWRRLYVHELKPLIEGMPPFGTLDDGYYL